MALFLTLGFAVACWIVGGQLIASANRNVPAPPAALGLESTRISSKSGSELATWFANVQNSKATIVLLHPVRSNRVAMLDRAKFFLSRNYSVVMIDFQAHGESLGDHITAGYLEKHDVKAAVAFARRQIEKSGNPDQALVAVGWSLGGASALMASPLDVDAMILESVFPTIETAIRNRVAMRLGPLSKIVAPCLLAQLPLRLGFCANDLRPIDQTSDVDCPVMFFFGDKDKHTSLEESVWLFDTTDAPKDFVIFAKANHTDLFEFDPELYQTKTVQFINNCHEKLP